jgi:hypothetical protein
MRRTRDRHVRTSFRKLGTCIYQVGTTRTNLKIYKKNYVKKLTSDFIKLNVAKESTGRRKVTTGEDGVGKKEGKRCWHSSLVCDMRCLR